MTSQNGKHLEGIKLVLIDIEGTLVPGKDVDMRPHYWGLLKGIAERKRNFLIGLSTGREAAYAVRFVELLGRNGKIIGESGGELYDCDTKITLLLIKDSKLKLLRQAERLLDEYVTNRHGTKEPKNTMLTYNPPAGVQTHAFCDELEAELSLKKPALRGELDFTFSQSAVDITCKGINKGTGALELAKMVAIPLNSIAIIGDSMNDIKAFAIIAAGNGVCVAPSNATQEVKEYINLLIRQGKPAYISDKHSTGAVLELLSDVLKQTDGSAKLATE